MTPSCPQVNAITSPPKILLQEISRQRLMANLQNSMKAIPLVDLQAQRRRLGARIDDAILRVCEHANFIMGDEVTTFERRLAEFCGVRHALTCGNGTDALLLGLMAKRVGPGHAVFCPTFTFARFKEVVAPVQATLVFVDALNDTFNIDPISKPRLRRHALAFGHPESSPSICLDSQQIIDASRTLPKSRDYGS
jgi:histidinol-phosphate/aromatic aminotransferase/cobyric acid decarboxylase-like protein